MNIAEKVLHGIEITKAEAMELSRYNLDYLCSSADLVRRRFCGDAFDICAIYNGKSGKCSEDCKFCAQSTCYKGECPEYPLKNANVICEDAKRQANQGINRYSIVTSGRKLSNYEINEVCEAYTKINNGTNISLCASHGLLDETQLKKLKQAGVTRYHNNLETSRHYFGRICSTHTYDEKIKTIKAAQTAGLTVCSGGIIGMGETMEDRIDLALCLRKLGIQSVPINILNPIKGTALAHQKNLEYDEVCRTIAVFRHILPNAFLRLAGGRGLIPDRGKRAFLSGANAAISGDMLTTSGINIKSDILMIQTLGFKRNENNLL